ncbi:hypothetical protein KJ652_02410 [Patescibacteria group bacterium]|nr:hypothetical protein [Patescibacteria group bacterium]MBU1123419.1 hypothetical protein [Patescibacteria group bacterium]
MKQWLKEKPQSGEEAVVLNNIITGTGRSGTTFLAHVFLNAGKDIGTENVNGIGHGGNPTGGGLEMPAFAKINTKMMHGFRDKIPEQMAEEFKSEMIQNWPEYIKDPRYCLTWPVWETLGIRPKHVFICMRDPSPTEKSVKSGTDWNMDNPYRLYRKAYGLLTYLLKNDISYTLVLYPRIGIDKDYTNKTLGEFIADPWEAVQRTWDGSMMHF